MLLIAAVFMGFASNLVRILVTAAGVYDIGPVTLGATGGEADLMASERRSPPGRHPDPPHPARQAHGLSSLGTSAASGVRNA